MRISGNTSLFVSRTLRGFDTTLTVMRRPPYDDHHVMRELPTHEWSSIMTVTYVTTKPGF